jgi:putative aldouronate transport system permease protein
MVYSKKKYLKEVGLMKIKKSAIFINAFIIMFCAACVVPLIAVIAISLSSDKAIITNGYSLIPQEFTFEAYRFVFNTSSLYNSYFVSIFVTVLGTMCGMAVNSSIAFALSKPDFKFRVIITFLVFFTMLFNGGMVANYMLITKFLHLKNNFFVLILPYVVNAWYILLLRTYMKSIPASVSEAAEIDGASQFRIMVRIILPLSKTAIATVSLFTALHYWNDWFLAMLYTTDIKLAPLQYLLYQVTMNVETLSNHMAQGSVENFDIQNLPKESARMAMCILAAGPMLVAFPFFQKYFVKGITVGSIKG